MARGGRIDRRAATAVVPHVVRFVRRIGGLMGQRRDPLTPSQKAALFVLEETGAIPMGGLGRSLGLSTAGASRIVDRLEALGLARRRPGPNRRTVLVVPTPRGRRSAHEMRRLMETLIGRALGRLPAGTAATVIEFYQALGRAAEEVSRRGAVRAMILARAVAVLLAAAPREVALETAVAEALARAPEVRVYEQEVERVRAGIGVVRAGSRPQVEGSGHVRRFETFRSVSVLGVDEVNLGVGLTVRQSIYSFGRLSTALEAAGAEEAAALAALAEARLAVRFAVEGAFLEALLAEALADAARENLAVAEALAARARAREEAGAGTRLDVVRAEAAVAAASARRFEAEAAEASARERLAAAMGLAPRTPVAPAGDLEGGGAPVPIDEAERLALAERPDLAVLAHRARSLRARAAHERAGGRPSLEAIASAEYQRREFITASPFFRGKDASSGFVGLDLAVPFADGGRARAAADAEEAAARATDARLERARLDAAAEVRRIRREIDAADSAVEARRAGVEAAAAALGMAEAAFDAGRATALDVIEASGTLAEARRGLAEAKYRRRIGIARLVRAAGTPEVVR